MNQPVNHHVIADQVLRHAERAMYEAKAVGRNTFQFFAPELNAGIRERLAIEHALAARSAREWSAHLNAHGVPAGEVLDVPSVLEHPQIVERGLLKTFESVPEVDRPVRVVRSGFRLASASARVVTARASSDSIRLSASACRRATPIA